MRPTVLQILPELDCGGVERGTLDIAAELVKRNHRSIVISGPGRLVSQLLDEGSEHINLPVGKKSILGARLIPKLRTIFKEHKVDIVHARSRFPAWLSYLAWKKMEVESRPYFITTVHGPYSVNRYSKIMTSGQRIIAISEYIKEYICDNYPNVNKDLINVVHRGISKKQYPYNYNPDEQWLNNWNLKNPQLKNKFIVTLPGRITRWKGHNDFIEIISRTIKKHQNVHGIIAGGIDPGKEHYLNELKTIVQRHNLSDHISFIGQRDDMREIMSISNIVLSLAKIPEAFGRTALEALFLGVPVIAYDHGGAAEVLSELFPEGKTPPLDINNVVALIDQFYEKTPLVPDKNIFTLQSMLDKTISIYNSLQR